MPADGITLGSPEQGTSERSEAKCGVILIGHGSTATALLEAAKMIVPGEGLAEVVALDAGAGRTPALQAQIRATIDELDQGRGILLISDLLGSSPCTCGLEGSSGRRVALVTGLNLAMLIKLGTADREVSPAELAQACADTGTRSVCVKVWDLKARQSSDCPS
ncbi:hypothetical protein G6O69_19910 [Pseudenhygromyxa sp. WMMC2535]|uniref:PTS sugar transporter subunit IIA n=1 Tax=Pseudenhygromyxa sp. WMMC2535 TaxID=2712867 RepID=UPI0015571214|nr:hypothetical protein [Pseudenhygromyxa sp. WMMC2535]NVB40122.1 hypothetical protein [Pseudenhygromyxa sp. WMMC2535]